MLERVTLTLTKPELVVIAAGLLELEMIVHHKAADKLSSDSDKLLASGAGIIASDLFDRVQRYVEYMDPVSSQELHDFISTLRK